MIGKFNGLMLGAALGALLAAPALAQDDTIKVGVLHSLSGTMAISRRRSRTPS